MQKSEDFILKLYQTKNTVFSIKEVALLFPEISRENLKARLNYYVKKKALDNVRKGIYAKSEYNPLELAAKIYTPSYVSLETVLEREGIVFQHYKTIFIVSYLTRKIEVNNYEIQYRRISEKILLDRRGVNQQTAYAVASKERAFLDALYLYKDYYFDNLSALDKEKIFELVDLYGSSSLTKRVKNIIKNV